MLNPSHRTKTASINLVLWNGFTDELQKIAAAMPTIKSVKPITKPVIREPEFPASTIDPIRNSKVSTPPPVTL